MLRKLRGERSATSVAAAVGISPQYLCDVERGRRPPLHPEHLKQFARVVHAPLEPLLDAYDEHVGGWWIERKHVPEDARPIVASASRERWSAELWAAVADAWRKQRKKEPP